MRAPVHRKGQGGFTLVEAVIVIAIIGIVGAMVSVFIVRPVRGYQDSVARAEASDIADLAIRRMTRDLRLALPNSIRVSADHTAVEFLQTKTGGRYQSAEDELSTGQALDFLHTATTTFSMLGALPTGKQTILPNDYVVVNNLGITPADAWQYNAAGVQRNIALVSSAVASASAGVQTITMASNPFASQTPPMPSPSARFQIVSGPVMYYCKAESPANTGNGKLARQSDHAIAATMIVPGTIVRSAAVAGVQTNLLATHLQSCRFEYETAASSRTALLRMTITLYMPETGAISLSHQIHVDNTP
jgi:MSHA biogenesis protein MshO